MGKVRLVLVSAVAGAVALAAVADVRARGHILETKSVYAGPNVFGTWTDVFYHMGAMTVTIDVSPAGSTAVYGEVEYYITEVKGNLTVNRKVTKSFAGSVTIRLGNVGAAVKVRLKGVPSGSACRVTVST